MTLATVNQHGVVARGYSTVSVVALKKMRCHCILRLAELKDGWRFGYDYGYSLGSSFGGPLKRDPKFPTRDAALRAGLANAREHFARWIRWHGARDATAVRTLKKALGIIDQFIAQKFPTKKEAAMPAEAVKSKPRKGTCPDPLGHFEQFVAKGRAAQAAADQVVAEHANGHSKKPHAEDGHKKANKSRASVDTPAAAAGRKGKEGSSPVLDRSLSPAAAAPLDDDSLPAGMTGTATPAGIRRFEDTARAIATGEEVEIHTALLHRHPDNRLSQDHDSDVQELAESIAKPGVDLLQAITVRVAPPHWDLPAGHFQIVCGERRWRACRVAGRGSVRCKIRTDLDDAATKEIIAIENAHRRDLNPIEKARIVERLCAANEDGSEPLTREQAAKDVGLESAAAASNLVRLLQLPGEWQDRVASGELPWTWAREIVPYVALEPVLTALEKEWAERETTPLWEDNAFHSRQNLEDSIQQFIELECRRLDEERWDGHGHSRLEVDLTNEHLREQLGIVELELRTGKLERGLRKGKPAKVTVATNVKAFDELLRKQGERRAKAAAAKVGADPEPPKKAASAGTREPTKAELREAAEERARALAGKINVWRAKLLRHEIARAIEEGRDDGWRLVMCYACYVNPRGPHFFEVLRGVTKMTKANDWSHTWPCVANVRTEADRRNITHAMALAILRDDSAGLDDELVGALAADLSVDLAGAWRWLQATHVPDREGRWSLLEEFFLLHRTDELQDLAIDLGVHFTTPTTKEKILKLFKSRTQPLPLPKSIKPLAIAGGKSKGRKARK